MPAMPAMPAVGGAIFVVLVASAVTISFTVKLFLSLVDFIHAYRIARKIPGPGLLAVLKYLAKTGKGALTVEAASDEIMRTLNDYKPTFKFWSGPFLVVLISEPCDLEYFFTNKDLLDKSTFYRFLEPFIGKGIVCLSGAIWRKHRKVLTPLLHLDILREYVNDFHKKSQTLADRLEADSQGGEKTIDLTKYLGLATADMITKTVLATEMSTQYSEERQFVRSIAIAMKLLLLRIMHPLYMNQKLFQLTCQHYKIYCKTVDVINDFITRIVQKKRENKEKTISQGGRRALIDMIVNSNEGDELTDEEVREETKTLVTVASGGTTDTLGFLLQTLALQPHVQAQCVEELHKTIEENGGQFSADVVTKLLYLDRVVRETLRLFPAIPIYARAVHKDTLLPSGVLIPKGTHLTVCTLITHRDEKNFPDPFKFDPDRFLPERKSEIHPFAYVPFSAGPRNCIGQRYAMLAIKTVVATLLTRFQILPGVGVGSTLDKTPKVLEDIRLNLGITITGRDGYKVRLMPRH